LKHITIAVLALLSKYPSEPLFSRINVYK